jgi:hypothetical protein
MSESMDHQSVPWLLKKLFVETDLDTFYCNTQVYCLNQSGAFYWILNI